MTVGTWTLNPKIEKLANEDLNKNKREVEKAGEKNSWKMKKFITIILKLKGMKAGTWFVLIALKKNWSLTELEKKKMTIHKEYKIIDWV